MIRRTVITPTRVITLALAAGVAAAARPLPATGASIGQAADARERADAAPLDSLERRISRIERGLLAPVQIRGREPERYEIAARMRFHGVPAVSVAVVEGGRLAWARAWGFADRENARSATTETLFQAASISKPLAALAALRLVDRGLLGLDDDVTELLTAWKLRGPAAGRGEPVTLRRLLSHTAGTTVHGFRGYAADQSVPSLLEVLQGGGPANSPPIRIDRVPGAAWRYSGGGYAVVQLLVEELTGRPFREEMRDVLDALGMRRSTFEQPLPDSLAERAAVGYRADGTRLPGGWHTYPEAAAAGMWTTPGDLARYMIEVGKWLEGASGGVLSSETTRAMLSPGPNRWGLGPSTADSALDFRFHHGGANEGFRSEFVYFPHRGIGAAVMTNGDGGGNLTREILYAIADEYDWPSIGPDRVIALPLPRAVAAAYTGRYRVSEAPDLTVTVRFRDGRLEIRTGSRPAAPLIRVGPDRFVNAADGEPIRFERDRTGSVVAAVGYGSRATRDRERR